MTLFRALGLVVALGLLTAAVCLLLVAMAASTRPAPGVAFDAKGMQALAAGSTVYAAGLVLLAIAVVVTGWRTLFAATAVVSLLALGAGIWLGYSTDSLVWSGGALDVVPRSLTAGVLIAAAILAIAGSALAFLRLPALPPVTRPHMPPPTHLA